MSENAIMYLPFAIAVVCIGVLVFRKQINAFIEKHTSIRLSEDQRKTINNIIENSIDYALKLPRSKTTEERKQLAMNYVVRMVRLTGVDEKYLPLIREIAEEILEERIKD